MHELILVRHGETTGKSTISMYGATDIALNDLGREQMARAGRALSGVDFKAVFTSPLGRTVEGAQLILNSRGPAATTVNEFSEMYFGDWEGLTLAEIEASDPDNFLLWKTNDLGFRYPAGESRAEFHARVARGANRVFAEFESPALCVVHKGVIRAIICALLGISHADIFGYKVELGSIHRLTKDETGQWKLISKNETDHLGDTRMPNS